jgi:hypothetical protein
VNASADRAGTAPTARDHGALLKAIGVRRIAVFQE